MRRALFPAIVTQAQIDAEVRRREALQRAAWVASGIAGGLLMAVAFFGAGLILVGLGVAG
jgi:hypothetical protein